MSLAVVLPGNRREVVKTSPTSAFQPAQQRGLWYRCSRAPEARLTACLAVTLGAVLAEACARPKPPLAPSEWALHDAKRKAVELGAQCRFLNLQSGAVLTLVRVAPPSAPPQPPPPTEPAQPPQQPPLEPADAAAPPEEPSPAPAAAEAGAPLPPPPPSPPPPPPPPASDPGAAASAASAALVGRSVRVYPPGREPPSAGALPPADAPLPEDFYELTPHDVQSAAAAAAARASKEGALQTRAMRDAASAAAASRFARALLRVRMSDGCVLEASFSPTEHVAALYELVSRCLHPSIATSFHLFTTPPRARVGPPYDVSLYFVGFVPAARVHCAVDAASLAAAVASGSLPRGAFLRPDLLAIPGIEGAPPAATAAAAAGAGGAGGALAAAEAAVVEAAAAAARAAAKRAGKAPLSAARGGGGGHRLGGASGDAAAAAGGGGGGGASGSGEEQRQPGEGVRPPGELRDKLKAMTAWPKWLKRP